jgi:ABC-type taurine transport system ATPase subunit
MTLRRFSDGTLFIDLAGQTNQQYVIQTSTNLLNWQNLSTNIAFGGSLRVTGIGVGNTGTLYYRAIASP